MTTGNEPTHHPLAPQLHERTATDGWTLSDAADEAGVSERHARRILAGAGLTGAPGRPIERPVELDDPEWLRSAPAAELAELAGVSVRTVRRAIAATR